MTAVALGQMTAVKLLLARGADPSIKVGMNDAFTYARNFPAILALLEANAKNKPAATAK